MTKTPQRRRELHQALAEAKERIETLEAALRLWWELLDSEGNIAERFEDQQSIAIEATDGALNPQREAQHE